jgi:hypothetical protein
MNKNDLCILCIIFDVCNVSERVHYARFLWHALSSQIQKNQQKISTQQIKTATRFKLITFKYSSIISSNYVFKGLAFETLGPWCKEAIDFINVIGNRLIAESGDSKSKKFLFERISLAIQRGNAASIRGTFPDSAILSEIFVL